MDALSEANGTFAMNLLKTLAKSNSKNIFYSPMSISSALAMVLMGARGNTAAQMSQVLSFSKGGDKDVDIHKGFQLLLAEMNRTDTQYLLRTANRLFGEKSHDLLSYFTDSCSKFYQATMEQLDFVNAAEKSRQHINTWVADKTEGKITELLPSGSIDSMTKLVLVNAIYFKGNWNTQFDKEKTREMPFHISKTEKRPVQMMYRKSNFEITYVKEISTQILVLPYVGNELRMVIMLPDGNTDLNEEANLRGCTRSFDEELLEMDQNGDAAAFQARNAQVEKELSYEKFIEWTSPRKFCTKEVEVFLPRFKLEENYNMEDVLRGLGMVDAFDPHSADFSGMSSDRELYLSKVIHKSQVEVTEEGYEIVMCEGSPGHLSKMATVTYKNLCTGL